jgi:hypothetical protein
MLFYFSVMESKNDFESFDCL